MTMSEELSRREVFLKLGLFLSGVAGMILGVPILGYIFPIGGQAHYLQPFGELLRAQAMALHGQCPFDLTP